MYEERSVETAKTIRDGELAQLLEECAMLLDKPALSTEEVKKITSVYSQLSLSAEYISTLALHLAESGKFTATNLAKKAKGLAEKGIDSLGALCVYIEDTKSENGTDKEFRRLFGIWNRKLSRADREYFRHWSEDFGYSTEIVGEAYGIMTANNASGGVSLKYIDTILTHWHEAGCKTVAQCRAEEERSRAEKAEKNGGKIGRKKPEAKPKFVDFDVEDAFQRALQRSYGNGENDN
jgi:DnaD/phage-associated family protein